MEAHRARESGLLQDSSTLQEATTLQKALQKRAEAGSLVEEGASTLQATLVGKGPQPPDVPQDEKIDAMIQLNREAVDAIFDAKQEIQEKEKDVLRQFKYANWQIKDVYKELAGTREKCIPCPGKESFAEMGFVSGMVAAGVANAGAAASSAADTASSAASSAADTVSSALGGKSASSAAGKGDTDEGTQQDEDTCSTCRAPYKDKMGECCKPGLLGNIKEWKFDKAYYFSGIQNTSEDMNHVIKKLISGSLDLDNEIASFFKAMERKMKTLGWHVEGAMHAPIPILERDAGATERDATHLEYKVKAAFGKFNADRAEMEDEVRMRKNQIAHTTETRLMDVGSMSMNTLQGTKDYVEFPANPVSMAKRMEEEGINKAMPPLQKLGRDGPGAVSKLYHKYAGYIQQKGADLMQLNDLDWDLIYQELSHDSNDAVTQKIEDLRLLLLDSQEWSKGVGDLMQKMEGEQEEGTKAMYGDWKENVTKEVQTVDEVQQSAYILVPFCHCAVWKFLT
jgi:hypothetical protein